MTTIGIIHERSQTTAKPAESRSRVQRLLLLAGLLSSLLYVATDLVGGMRYAGYSFASQAVSELMAIGAPSETFVDPLFIIYGVLVLAFGVGVFREGVGRSSALRITGALLMGYAVIGLTGPTLFEMHQRGTNSVASDVPHIVLTGVLSLLTLLAIGCGASALGRRFRAFSFATLLTLIAFGAVTATYAARLAAGQPTPGMGITERIDIYSALLWLAVLSVALTRRTSARDRGLRP